jgi:hypothetical protein
MVKDQAQEVGGEKDLLCSYRGAEDIPDADYKDEFGLASGTMVMRRRIIP